MDFNEFEKICKNNQTDENTCVRFYDRIEQTGNKKADGLPELREVCYVEIRFKDNITEIYDQPADEEKKRRYPVEYARYQMMKKQSVEGTPLNMYAFLTSMQQESLKLHGIFTVEALIALPKDKIQLLGIEKEYDEAVKFMDRAKNNGSIAEWQKKEEEYKTKISQLENKIEQLNLEIDKLNKPAKDK